MKFYEKIVCLALLAAFITSLVGCSNLAPESSDNSESAKPKSIKNYMSVKLFNLPKITVMNLKGLILLILLLTAVKL